MEKHSSFTRRIIINKNISNVFDSWSIQEGMENWFLKSAVFTRRDQDLNNGERITEGDTYKWIWHTWPDNVQEGVVTNCEKDKHFAFTFDPAGNVDVQFNELENDVTEVAITQTDIISDGDSWYPLLLWM